MAINNISNSNPSTQKLVLLLAAIFLLLAIKETSAQAPVSFDFPRFLANDNRITRQGSTQIQNGVLRLPGNLRSSWQTGRILYSFPVAIWNTAGADASFVTEFRFAVGNYSRSDFPADGLAFFLAPFRSQIPSNSGGGNLGIFDENSSTNQFVAVEFDSYSNRWDPSFPHVGINVRSRSSARTMRWNRASGWSVGVYIVYDAPTKTLKVTVTDNQTGRVSTMSHVVDLRARLPAACSVGFSATHSGYREIREIYSWSFRSTFNTLLATKNITTIASSAAAAA